MYHQVYLKVKQMPLNHHQKFDAIDMFLFAKGHDLESLLS